MPSDIMNHARAVRREDLFRDAESPDEGHHARNGGQEDEEEAAARAALDAYMKDTLGLQLGFAPPPPQSAAPKPAKANAKGKAEKTKIDSDEAMDSTDDDDDDDEEARQSKKPTTEKAGGATEFAFRMFSGSGKAAAATKDANASEHAGTATSAALTPIVLLDDGDGTEAPGPGGIVNPPRPLSFYLAGEPTAEARAQYAQSTLTGEDVIKAANTRAWGWEVPWRVRTVLRAESKAAMRALLANALPPQDAAALPTNLRHALASATNAIPAWALSSSSSSSQSPEPPTPLPLIRQPLPAPLQSDEATKKHRRPGKLRRIKLRKRVQAKRDKEARAAAQKQSKEEHLLEKKKRLNRNKKLRRREKKRQTKGAEDGEGGDDASANDSGDE
ncbi:hypothetical protein SCUCBS95973_000360 [Sporothrix curviconia]|uniref:Uncharacterized protein n=1 Tax=Sporothrix curviconia TaxID=1260050 RepID=A0ABP0APH3_9PEZI